MALVALLVVWSVAGAERVGAQDAAPVRPLPSAVPTSEAADSGASDRPLDARVIADRLFASTLTLRVALPRPVVPAEEGTAAAEGGAAPRTTDAPRANAGGTNDPDSDEQPPARVVVSSGVVVGEGLLITFGQYPAQSQFRLTLPGGSQADAELRVIDFYSGLSLLEVVRRPQRDDSVAERVANRLADDGAWAEIPSLPLTDKPPQPGSPIYSAAASGLERPVVSRGILGGLERTLSGTSLPPLLQCDVRTTDTSCGAAVADEFGRMIGVVAVTAATPQAGGWTYAIPADHVQRLLNARADDRLVVLHRRRPSAGLTLVAGPQEGLVRVERVTRDGPAEQAGIRAGDDLLEVDGLKVRNVYQFVGLVLKKQPGDRVELLVRQPAVAGQPRAQREPARRIEVTLGGGSIVDPAELIFANGQLVIRSLQVGRDGDGYSIRRGNRGESDLAAADGRPVRDELTLLREQLERFGAYIEVLRRDVRGRDEEIQRMQRSMQALEREIQTLRAKK